MPSRKLEASLVLLLRSLFCETHFCLVARTVKVKQGRARTWSQVTSTVRSLPGQSGGGLGLSLATWDPHIPETSKSHTISAGYNASHIPFLFTWGSDLCDYHRNRLSRDITLGLGNDLQLSSAVGTAVSQKPATLLRLLVTSEEWHKSISQKAS